MVCVGSIKELEELTGTKVKDLHRESVDHLVIQGKTGPLRRVDEVGVFDFLSLPDDYEKSSSRINLNPS